MPTMLSLASMAASGSANKIISSRLISAKNHHIHSARHKHISVQGRNFLYSCLRQDGCPHCLLSICNMPFPVPFLHGRQKTNASTVFLFIVIVVSHILTNSRANEKTAAVS